MAKKAHIAAKVGSVSFKQTYGPPPVPNGVKSIDQLETWLSAKWHQFRQAEEVPGYFQDTSASYQRPDPVRVDSRVVLANAATIAAINWLRDHDHANLPPEPSPSLRHAMRMEVEGGQYVYRLSDNAAEVVEEARRTLASVVDYVRARSKSGGRVHELTETERTFCDAISKLWSQGTEWPPGSEIEREAGFGEGTTKTTLAQLVKRGVLEKGANGRGYRVRT